MSVYEDDAQQVYSTCSKMMWYYFVSVMASLFRTLSAVVFFWSACTVKILVYQQYFHKKYKISTTAHEYRNMQLMY